MGGGATEGLAHATSGALASAIAFSLLFPLDQLRLRRQCLVRQEASGPTSARAILRQVLREEGCAAASGQIRAVASCCPVLVHACAATVCHLQR